MYFTNDPLRDFERYEAEQAEKTERLPVCEICGEHIQDEYGYCVDSIFCVLHISNCRQVRLLGRIYIVKRNYNFPVFPLSVWNPLQYIQS